MLRRLVLPALALLALPGCSDTKVTTDPGASASGNLRFVSGVHGAVNVLVDGTPVLQNVPLGALAGTQVAAGSHSVTIQKVGGVSGVSRSATFSATGIALVIGTDSAGAPRPSILLDTNSTVPAGATKLRVAHFASGAPTIDVWRTQPDWQTPIRLVFPFNYNFTSAYVQSTPGDWRVMISHPIANVTDPMPDTLANTGLIPIADGKSRTVIVVDGAVAGTVQLVVVEP